MKTIRMLAKSRMKYNKSRTLLTGVAIMLTTVLLMGVGTSAVGLLDMNRQQAAAADNVHATLRDLNQTQVDMLKNHMDVEALEINEIFATVEYGKMNGFLNYTRQEKEGIYHSTGNLIEGHFAEAADEICGPKAFFERLDVEPVIGNRVTISFRPNGEGEIATRDFTICGLVTQNDPDKLNISDSRIAYGASVSEALVDAFLAPDARSFQANIRVAGEQDLNYDEITAKIEEVAAAVGCTREDIRFNIEYLYTMTDPGTEMVGIVSGIAILIIIFSALVIYSIYYVGVITDVQEIGKLKALGASKKQIKRLLLSEGLRVSALAIPLGLLLGFAIPYFIMPIFMRRALETSISAAPITRLHMFSLPVLVIVAAAVLLTVWLSLLKPMRMAAKIPPVEAIRYQESSGSTALRKGNKTISVFRLSAANLMRNKKRTLVTVLTMGLSCVLFMSLAGVMNSMSAEDIARRSIETGDFRLSLDYAANDAEYPENNLDQLQLQNLFSPAFVSGIEGIDGVEGVQRTQTVLIGSDYPSELFKDGRRATLSGFDREKAEAYRKETERGEIDYDRLVAENGAVFTSDTFWDEYGLSIGDTIPLTVYDGNRQIKADIKLMASISSGGESHFIIPQEVYDRLGLQTDTTTDLYISVDAAKYDEIKPALQRLAEENPYFQLYSMDEELEIGGMSVNMVKYPMYAILLLIAVIGFMNLINTMITSIVTRKRELGVLQAIGLSDRQLALMLAGEELFFTAGTLLAAVTLGNLFGYLVFLWAKESHFMSVSAYHYPVWETVVLAAVLLFGQLIVARFINRRVHRESLIDRIRSGE